MRCPSCGTENAPDSRFCGGCGGKMPTAHSLVAPTQKMSDDTPYRPSGAQAVAPHSIPPENNRHISHPPQMPAPLDVRAITTRPGAGTPPQPHNQAIGSTPPAGYSMPPPSQPPRVSSRGATVPSPTPVPQQRHRANTPAESIAASVPRRRWGLILFVLLIDIGLAASGAWMLSQGLAN